ncbi:MAG: hypothetical protein KAX33_01525 [Candidatus Lokiarchaeota archaeon]|nr:hypothetical protein [Candidatus Lokiarchaeota archaeon]
MEKMQLKSFSLEVQNKVKENVKWTNLLPKDSRKFLIESGESFTVYRTLTDLFELPIDHPDVIQAHQDMLEDPLVDNLLENLSDWEKDIVTAHNKADYLPNQLWLLLDWGLTLEDDKRFKKAFDKILAYQDKEFGQFLAYSRVYDTKTKTKYPAWSSYLCDHNLIVSILLLAGLKDDNRVKKGLKRINELLTETTQGMGWKCVPNIKTKRRGPGRVNDVCPIIVADVLRGYWVLPEKEWPEHLIEAGKTLLNCWLSRSEEKPYMFGHGRNFRKPRAPFFWYNIGTILDAVSHYSELVKTQAFRELIAVSLLAWEPIGVIIPKTVYLYFNSFSFGQKKEPSPWMTLFLSRIYKRAVDYDPSITYAMKKIDGKSLKGSKGGPKSKKS